MSMMKKIMVMVLCLTFTLVSCKTKPAEDELSATTVSELNSLENANVFDGNPKTVQEGVSEIYLCELYLKVLEDLWNVDAGLNNEISQIGIDLSGLSDLSEIEKDYVMNKFAEKHNLPYIVGTWEELCKQGFIDKDNLYWEDGLFFSIKTNEDTISFDAHKWRSGLGAYFFGECSAEKNTDGTWSYTVGKEAIS